MGDSEFLQNECDTGGDGWSTKQFRKVNRRLKDSFKAIMVNDELVAKKDSVCMPCTECKMGEEWTRKKCQTPEVLGQTTVVEKIKMFKGDNGPEMPRDSVCADCKGCMEDGVESAQNLVGTDKLNKWATTTCNNGHQGFPQCDTCTVCKEGEEFIAKPCSAGTPYQMSANTEIAVGEDTVCQKCSTKKEGEWTVFPCSNKHTSDAIFQKCSECKDGEYKFADCTDSSDTVCPACPSHVDKLFQNDDSFKSGLQYCNKDSVTNLAEIRCWAKEVSQADGSKRVEPQKSLCGEWSDQEASKGKKIDRCRPSHTQGGGNCGEWTSYCKEGFSGESCCYHKHDKNCGTHTTRERSGKRAGFIKGKSFVDFCRSLCDEFPDCLAFEVQDGGTEAQPAGQDDLDNSDTATCFFKSAYTQNQKFKFNGEDPMFDCYSNTCRQNKYTTSGSGKSIATVNYRVPRPAPTTA